MKNNPYAKRIVVGVHNSKIDVQTPNGSIYIHQPVTYYEADTNPEEEAIALLKEKGYDVIPPKPKKTGKGYVYYIGGLVVIYSHEQQGSYKPIAIINWTEGDGI